MERKYFHDLIRSIIFYNSHTIYHRLKQYGINAGVILFKRQEYPIVIKYNKKARRTRFIDVYWKCSDGNIYHEVKIRKPMINMQIKDIMSIMKNSDYLIIWYDAGLYDEITTSFRFRLFDLLLSPFMIHDVKAYKLKSKNVYLFDIRLIEDLIRENL